MPLLVRSGITPSLFSLVPRGPEDQGFIIAVLENVPVPESAQKFLEMLEVADIHAKIVPGNWGQIHSEATNSPQFIFYAAPAPLL